MKKLLILSLVFSAIQVNAQWYTKQFGVTDINDLNQEQLNIALDRANYTRIYGKTFTVIGTTMMVGGAALFAYSWSTIDVYEEPTAGLIFGGLFIFTGSLINLPSIPIWIVGKHRTNVINVQLTKFNDTSYIPSIGIRITF